MKLLSCKFQMTESFNVENFYQIILNWLDNSRTREYADDLCGKFENADKACLKLKTEHCTAETSNIDNYSLFRLINSFYEQEWTTEAIFENSVKKSVTLHISCDGDTSRLSEVPEMRTDIIKFFAVSGLVKCGRIPVSDKPVIADDKLKSWLIDTVNGKIKNDLPVVFITRLEDMIGYAVDENRVARRLAGLAYVVAEGESDFAFGLRNATDRRIPYNGNIGIFYPDASQNKNFKEISERDIIGGVIDFMTALTDRDSVDWDKLHTREKKELVELLDNKTESLEEQLRSAKEEAARLQAKCDHLQAALDSTINKKGLIEASPESELFNFEQNDLIVCALELYLKGCVVGTRSYELAKSILSVNGYKGEGKEIFDRAKSIISKGRLSDKDFTDLDKLGFKLIRNGTHNNLIFKEAKQYPIILSSTPSDKCSGLNTVSDVLNKLSIYK